MANWGNLGSRGNVEDRRGVLPIATGGIGLTVTIVIIAFNLLSGGSVSDTLQQLDQLQGVQIQQQSNVNAKDFEGEDSYEVFASTVLGSNNDMWKNTFSKLNKNYNEPKLVLFRSATQSSCGNAASDVGPHYCPADETIYIDETFFDELTKRFGAKGGDVAEAYVISHEVGHHVQNQLGITDKLTGQDQNEISIKIELQADCFAGLWASSIKNANVFENDEINEAIDAAAAVGDDRIQTKVNGQINPETWTHGSSEQRVQRFNNGYNSGQLSACDTLK